LLTDYQRIWNTPYNDAFWNAQNLTFSKLDTLSEYEDLNLNSSNSLLNKRYLSLSEAKNLELSHFEHVPRMDDGAVAMIKFDPLDMKTQRHLHAHFFAHLYQLDDVYKVSIVPLIDHQRSFVSMNTPMLDSLFNKELEIVTVTSEEARIELESTNLANAKNPYKLVSRLVERYNKLLKQRLSVMDAHQNRDWSVTTPVPVSRSVEQMLRRQ
jgi:hypothetical protein